MKIAPLASPIFLKTEPSPPPDELEPDPEPRSSQPLRTEPDSPLDPNEPPPRVNQEPGRLDIYA